MKKILPLVVVVVATLLSSLVQARVQLLPSILHGKVYSQASHKLPSITNSIYEASHALVSKLVSDADCLGETLDKAVDVSLQKVRQCASWYRFPDKRNDESLTEPRKSTSKSTSVAGGNLMATNFVRHAVDAVGPCVVRIDCERDVSDLMSALYGERILREQKSLHVAGSGVVASKEGHILTNAHVVDSAKRLVVTFSNGRSYKASFIASDEFTDLAVIKVAPRSDQEHGSTDSATLPASFPTAAIGDSDELCSGDWVVAVGSPMSLDFSVTLGVVSSPKRSSHEIGVPGLKGHYIQMDAALNSGNSGGPLVNERGEVVGINSMTARNAEAIGFAIPVNRAMEAFQTLRAGRKPPHSFFGLSLTTTTPDRSRINNDDPNTQRIPVVHGALITRILPGSPAEGCGLRRNDVIIDVNGQAIHNSGLCDDTLDKCVPGQRCRIRVARGDAAKEIITVDVVPRDLHALFAELKRRSNTASASASSGPFMLPPAP